MQQPSFTTSGKFGASLHEVMQDMHSIIQSIQDMPELSALLLAQYSEKEHSLESALQSLLSVKSSHAESPPLSTLSALASEADTAQPKPDWLEVIDWGNAVIAAKAYKNGRKSSWRPDGISLAMVRNDLEKHKAAYEVKKKTSLRDLDLELLASACFASGKLRTLSEKGFEYFCEELGEIKDAVQTPSGSSATRTAEGMGQTGKIKVD